MERHGDRRVFAACCRTLAFCGAGPDQLAAIFDPGRSVILDKCRCGPGATCTFGPERTICVIRPRLAGELATLR